MNKFEITVTTLPEINVETVKKSLKKNINLAIKEFKENLEIFENQLEPLFLNLKVSKENHEVREKANLELAELKKMIKKTSLEILDKSSIIKKPIKELSDLIIKEFENKVKANHKDSLIDSIIKKITDNQYEYQKVLQKEHEEELKKQQQEELIRQQEMLKNQIVEEEDFFSNLEKEMKIEELQKEKENINIVTTEKVKVEGLRTRKIMQFKLKDISQVKTSVLMGSVSFNFLMINEKDISNYIIANKKFNKEYDPTLDQNLSGLEIYFEERVY